MKWSWKTFGTQLAAAGALALAVTYLIFPMVAARRSADGPDPTTTSMVYGGVIAPMVLAVLAGWRGWTFKPLAVAGFVVSGFFASNPGVGGITIFLMGLVYVFAAKVKLVACYYFPTLMLPRPTPRENNDDGSPKEE
ncbi:MAG TPA: hypothetical protein VGO11_11690 [Chthoniobacteraceae bacterium]|jgi:hypothetical protein|nr:hypothetical protein [Chthoniobacteraceae bacterium]